MISLEEIKTKIENGLKTNFVKIVDLRGGDHIQAIVVSSDFEGKSLVDQHKLIYSILNQEMNSNVIHALSLKTFSPSQWDSVKNNFKIGVEHEI